MSAGGDQDEPVVVDVYGVKVRARAVELSDPEPTSWKEVGTQINRHLLRIAAAPTRLLAELLEGATRLVKGISQIPTSAAARLERSHAEADIRENLRQMDASSPRALTSQRGTTDIDPKLALADEALQRIDAILRKYRQLGTDAYVVFDPNGKVLVVVGTPPTTAASVVASLTASGMLTAEGETSGAPAMTAPTAGKDPR